MRLRRTNQPDIRVESRPFGEDVFKDLPDVQTCVVSWLVSHGFVHADAEDAAQEAALSAHRRINAGKTIRNLKPWLKKAAYRAALKMKRKPSPAALDADVLDLRAAFDRLDCEDRGNAIAAALLELPGPLCDALILVYHSGQPYREASEILEVSPAAVSKRLNQARHLMQSRLRDFNEFAEHGCAPECGAARMGSGSALL